MVTRDAAAIQALIGTIRMSTASTMMGLREVLREAGEALSKQHDAPLSISSLCELFVRFVTRTALASAEVDFDAMRKLLLERGEMLARTTLEARSKIARNGAPFIDAGGVILTQGYSRVVVALLLEAAKTRHFSVMVAESHPEGEGHSTAEALASASVPVTMIEHAAVAYAMSRCQMVLVGAEAVLEWRHQQDWHLPDGDRGRRVQEALLRGRRVDQVRAPLPALAERLAWPRKPTRARRLRRPRPAARLDRRREALARLHAAVVHHDVVYRPRRSHPQRCERRAHQALRLSAQRDLSLSLATRQG